MQARQIHLVLGLTASLTVGAVAAGGMERVLRLEVTPRAHPGAAMDPTAEPAMEPLLLRLVDHGGIGIPPDTSRWGADYSHNTRAFHRLILDSKPYVDVIEFARIRSEWTEYVERMAAYGSNGVVVPVFLELVTFDERPEVYAGTDLGERHQVVRERFRELFSIARDAGLGVYLKTDIAPLTPPLERYLQRHGGVTARNPALWETYRAAFRELITEIPEVRGVVVRIGEAGSLYNRAGWDYRSEYLIGRVDALHAMLDALLPVFEAHGRDLILRSWSVGVGELGALHTDPALYERALGAYASPRLVVSTKFHAGDFYRPLPVNSTLLSGKHRRIIEFQARREFEGFGAFPNHLASLHERALDAIRAANPRVEGSWVWTQEGGPLRAGPMSLYPMHGFWTWIDANVYTTSRLAVDPSLSADEATAEWVRATLTTDSAAVLAITRLLGASADAIDRGFYVTQFATQHVRYAGYELPPLLWIMEWDLLGGWSAVWSTLHTVARGAVDEAVHDGFAAVNRVTEMRALLETARPALEHRPELLDGIERSLDYQASLFETLAWYRAAYLNYYAWLETGDGQAYRDWRKAAAELRDVAAEHDRTYDGDPDFPAFETLLAVAGVGLAARSAQSRWIARGIVVLLVAGMIAGTGPLYRRLRRRPDAQVARAFWLSLTAPWHLTEERLPAHATLAAFGLTIAILTMTMAAAISFTSSAVALGVPIALGALLIVLKSSWTGFTLDRGRDAVIAAALGPLTWVALALLAAMSVRGPQYLWHVVWSGGWMRPVLVTVAGGIPIWTMVALATAGRRLEQGTRRAATGAVLMATAAALFSLGVLAPGVEQLLGALNQPLAVAPVTHAVVTGITTYTDLPRIAGWYPLVLGTLALLGVALRLSGGGRLTPAVRSGE